MNWVLLALLIHFGSGIAGYALCRLGDDLLGDPDPKAWWGSWVAATIPGVFLLAIGLMYVVAAKTVSKH